MKQYIVITKSESDEHSYFIESEKELNQDSKKLLTILEKNGTDAGHETITTFVEITKERFLRI
jgi:hypothetical protein